MTRNGHTLEYMDFLKRLGVNAKPKNQTASKTGTCKLFLHLQICLTHIDMFMLLVAKNYSVHMLHFGSNWI